MKPFDADGCVRWLFCFTHPDDEIAVCAWIKRLVNAGAEVFISWTHDTPVREAEARAVAELLGVPADRLFFHHAKDGHVCEQVRDLLPAFKEMMRRVAPDRVACAAFEQGHLDHDATNFLVNHSFDGPVFEFPLYHAYDRKLQTINRFAAPLGEDVIELDPEEQRLKVEVARRYPSQNIWRLLCLYEAYRILTLRPALLKRTERLRLQTHVAFLKPNLPTRLRRRVQRSPQWLRWVMTVGPVALELADSRESLVSHGRELGSIR